MIAIRRRQKDFEDRQRLEPLLQDFTRLAILFPERIAKALAPPSSTAAPQAEAPVEDAAKNPGYRFAPIDSKTFAAADYRPSWLVKRLLVRGQPAIVGGPKKSLKTAAMIDLALSLATGGRFLGSFDAAASVRVAMVSGESGEHTIQETARRVAAAKGIDLEDANCLWDFRLPQLSSVLELKELQRGLQAHGIAVAILDPLYLSLLAGNSSGLQASSLYDMGPLLLRVSQACLSVGCTPILAHHFKLTRANHFDAPALEDLAFAGIQEFARQWLLLGRREAYEPGTGQHRLWLSAGGSIGHGGLWALNVDEGELKDDFTGRTWEVNVSTATEAKSAKEEERAAKGREKNSAKERDQETKLLVALDALADSRGVAVYSRVRGASCLGGDAMEGAVLRLKTQGIIEEVPTAATAGQGAKKEARGLRRKRD